ncbi:MAG: DMT family transporter [Bacteroidota bacterium]|nr:DMT family transporter [Bacteroidota bacterium]
MPRRTLAHIALFLVNLIYGINFVVAKGLMPVVIQPSAFILMRVSGACILFWILRLFLPERVVPSDVKRLFLCALFGVVINQLMFFEGLMRTSPINSSIIMVATPILVLVMSAMLIGERITWLKIIGVLLGASGAIALVFLKPEASGPDGSRLGDLFILINAISYALFLVIVKPLMARYSAVTVMAWCFLFGLVMMIPIGIGDLLLVDWKGLTRPLIAAMAFVVIMVTFVAYLMNTWALRIVEPSLVGMYVYLQPLMAVLLTWLFMRIGAERIGIPGNYDGALGLPQIICASLIFLGVHLVGRKPSTR